MNTKVKCLVSALCLMTCQTALTKERFQSQIVETPYQWKEFCKYEGQQDPVCNLTTQQPIKFKEKELLSVLHSVNAEFNQFFFMKDSLKYGRDDKWTATLGNGLHESKRGDCDDYALSKRKKLMDLGIPSSMLLVTLVRVSHSASDLHMVLIVNSGKKQFVLDNINREIVESRELPYIGVSQLNPNDGNWYTISVTF